MEELKKLYDEVIKNGFKYECIMFPDDDSSYEIEFSTGKNHIIFDADFTLNPSTDRIYSYTEDTNGDFTECTLFFEDLTHVYGFFNAIHSLRNAGKDDIVTEFFDSLEPTKMG